MKKVCPKRFRAINAKTGVLEEGRVLYNYGKKYGITDFPSSRAQLAISAKYGARDPEISGDLINNNTLEWQCPECDSWNDNYKVNCNCGCSIRI